MLEALTKPPMNAKELADQTTVDTTLSEVLQAVKNGKVKKLTGERFTVYKLKATELSIHCGSLMWGSHVVIPTFMGREALALVHAGHRGLVAMKACARSYLWWPGINKEIESCVAKRDTCQWHQKAKPKCSSPIWERLYC